MPHFSPLYWALMSPISYTQFWFQVYRTKNEKPEKGFWEPREPSAQKAWPVTRKTWKILFSSNNRTLITGCEHWHLNSLLYGNRGYNGCKFMLGTSQLATGTSFLSVSVTPDRGSQVCTRKFSLKDLWNFGYTESLMHFIKWVSFCLNILCSALHCAERGRGTSTRLRWSWVYSFKGTISM